MGKCHQTVGRETGTAPQSKAARGKEKMFVCLGGNDVNASSIFQQPLLVGGPAVVGKTHPACFHGDLVGSSPALTTRACHCMDAVLYMCKQA